MTARFAPSVDSPIEVPRWDSASAQRRAVSLGRWASLGSFALMLCLWLAIIGSTWSVHETAIGRAMASADNLSAAFCQQVNYTLGTIKAAMDLTARDIRADPTGFQLDQWSREIAGPGSPNDCGVVGRRVRKGHLHHDQIRCRRHRPERSGSIQRASRADESRSYISVPAVVTMPRVRPLIIELSRRVVSDANGHFLGILVFALAPDDLIPLYRVVKLGPRGIIATGGRGRLLRARLGDAPEPAAATTDEPWPVMLDPGATDGVMQSQLMPSMAYRQNLIQCGDCRLTRSSVDCRTGASTTNCAEARSLQ